MRVAVTGANGFIGRHVVAELAKHPVEIIAVNRTQVPATVQSSSCRTVALDIHHAPEESYELLGKPDVLIDLAWGYLPHYSSLEHIEIELPAHYRFLRALVRSGLGSLLVSGTCFEYGMQSGPLSEDMHAEPANPYSFAKDALRRELEFLKATRPVSITWARLFYVYGAGQHEGSLFSQLRKAVTEEAKVFKMSGGEQLRDFLPVASVSRYLAELALSRADIGVVNVCSGQPISVRSLVEGWLQTNRWAIELELGAYPYAAHEPMAFWGNRQRLERYVEI